MSWVRNADGGWNHRPWWKVAINTALRLLQPGVRRKCVLFTVAEDQPNGPPRVIGYGFGRVLHR